MLFATLILKRESAREDKERERARKRVGVTISGLPRRALHFSRHGAGRAQMEILLDAGSAWRRETFPHFYCLYIFHIIP